MLYSSVEERQYTNAWNYLQIPVGLLMFLQTGSTVHTRETLQVFLIKKGDESDQLEDDQGEELEEDDGLDIDDDKDDE